MITGRLHRTLFLSNISNVHYYLNNANNLSTFHFCDVKCSVMTELLIPCVSFYFPGCSRSVAQPIIWFRTRIRFTTFFTCTKSSLTCKTKNLCGTYRLQAALHFFVLEFGPKPLTLIIRQFAFCGSCHVKVIVKQCRQPYIQDMLLTLFQPAFILLFHKNSII